MKFTQKQKEWDNENNKYIFYPRIYSDFYCSLTEWKKLGREKDNFMYQIREKIAKDFPELCDDYNYKGGCKQQIPSLDRTGIRDSTYSAIYSAKIIKKAIELIKENNIDLNNIIVHAPYIVNMASDNDFAVDFLKQEMEE